MNSKLSQLVLFTQKINRQHIQMAFVLLTLVLLVLGASAPTDSGGVIGPR